MTIELLDPNDTGEIPRRIGETRMRIDAGEATQNLSPYLIPSGPFPIELRHNDMVPESLVTGRGYDPEAHVIDLDDTVTFHSSDGLAGPQKPPPPLPKPRVDPAETGVNIFGGLGADLPDPKPWPAPASAGTRSRCRHKVKAAFRQGLWIGALGMLAVYSGLVLAALVVVR
jgi:hypothetical protein